MEGVVEHSSNLPDPVALSSAESEYNKPCSACTAMAHLRMFLDELELKSGEVDLSIPILINNRSMINIGDSYKDTKHMQHILRRYHYV